MALMSAADALAAVLAGADALPEEPVALERAWHRVLARDLAAQRTQPPDDMSAMDGYAVRAADIASVPVRLAVIGEAAAGRPWDRPLQAGEAVRIFTGGVVPPGADTVVIQENTRRDGDIITIDQTAERGRNIRRRGIDFSEGDVLLETGRRLSDRNLALAASMNYPRLPVHRRPRVALLATGDELLPPGSDPGPGQIILSNGYALRALAKSGEPLQALAAEVNRCAKLAIDGRLQAAANVAQTAVAAAINWLQSNLSDRNALETGARRFALTLGRSLGLAKLIEQAQWSLDVEEDGRPGAAACRFAQTAINQIQAIDPADALALAQDL